MTAVTKAEFKKALENVPKKRVIVYDPSDNKFSAAVIFGFRDLNSVMQRISTQEIKEKGGAK